MPGRRHRTVFALGGIAVLLAAVVIYEIGRFHAGYNRFEAAAERRALEERIAGLEGELVGLKEQLTLAHTLRKTDAEAYRVVNDSLGGLQAKIQEQREAIAFYRGIISPEESKSGLRVQDLKVLRGADESRYRLRLVLVQVKKHHRKVRGKVRLSIDGERRGEAVSIPFAELAAAAGERQWPYAFRYFQDFERDLVLPPDFRPSQINIELDPSGKGNTGIRQTFPWSTTPGAGIG